MNIWSGWGAGFPKEGPTKTLFNCLTINQKRPQYWPGHAVGHGNGWAIYKGHDQSCCLSWAVVLYSFEQQHKTSSTMIHWQMYYIDKCIKLTNVLHTYLQFTKQNIWLLTLFRGITYSSKVFFTKLLKQKLSCIPWSLQGACTIFCKIIEKLLLTLGLSAPCWTLSPNGEF